MKNIHEWVNTILIGVVLALVLVGGNQSARFGATGTRFPNGLSTDSTSPSSGQVRATTLLSTAGLTVDTNTLLVDATNNLVGFATTTPGEEISFGKTSTTTLLFAGPVCFAVRTNGSGTDIVYYTFATSSATSRSDLIGLATTTASSCK